MKNLNEKELLNINAGGGLGVRDAIDLAILAWKYRDTISAGVNSKPGWRLPGGY